MNISPVAFFELFVYQTGESGPQGNKALLRDEETDYGNKKQSKQVIIGLVIGTINPWQLGYACHI